MLERRELVEHGPHAREVWVAGVRRRRVHAHEQELGRLRDLAGVEREREPLGVSLDELGQTGLEERQLAVLQALHLVADDVADRHLVPELGEARSGDETDPAGPEDADRLLHLPGPYRRASGRRPFAIEIIVSLESRSLSVFTTQYVAPFSRSTIMWRCAPE